MYQRISRVKTNQKKHEAKIKRLTDKLEAIEKQYPKIDFRNMDLIRAIDNHRSLTKGLIFAKVDLTACTEQKFKCEGCVCKK